MGVFHSLLLLGTKPQNDLEVALMAFLKGQQPLERFVAALRGARVHLMAKAPASAPAGGGLSMPILDGADGRPAFCVFTHPLRMKAYQSRLPEYGHALEMDFSGLLAMTPPGFGLLFNAGTVFSTEVLPEGVDDLR